MPEEFSSIEFSEGELTSLLHLLDNAGIFSCDYDSAISGIRKLRKALEEKTNGRKVLSKSRTKVNSKR
jgi:hypothetical protein